VKSPTRYSNGPAVAYPRRRAVTVRRPPLQPSGRSPTTRHRPRRRPERPDRHRTRTDRQRTLSMEPVSSTYQAKPDAAANIPVRLHLDANGTVDIDSNTTSPLYDPATGNLISKDRDRLAAGMRNLYAYRGVACDEVPIRMDLLVVG